MLWYNRIDASRFSMRDRKFFRLAMIEQRDRQTVGKLMGLSQTGYYKTYNRIMEYIEKDFRKYSLRNPHTAVPHFLDMVVEETPISQKDLQEANELQDVQQKYVSIFWPLPNRYKNNIERLLSKINSNG